MNKLCVLALATAAILTAAPSHAVSRNLECTVWSEMAHNIADGRDGGKTYQEQMKVIDKMKKQQGVSDGNVRYARGLVNVIYKDFSNKTPDEIETLVHFTCIAQQQK